MYNNCINKNICIELELNTPNIEIELEMGAKGKNGKDATINGVSTLNIEAGENISLEQEGSTLTISGTYEYDDTNIKKSIQENKTNIDTNTQDINNLKQKSDDNKNSIDEINENLKNYSLITETGNKIDVTVNSSTYVMTLDLKDKNDNVLSTGSVDLPIESMIINVTYDSEKKELKFTLQNGNIIEVPLNDLISGLVTDEGLENILKNYALIKDVPTKVSQLENDLDYVKNTDYATTTVAGVIKTNAGLDVDENGMVFANTYNYDEYEPKTDNTFISKGTLEKVITGKNLETANNKVTSVGTSSTDTEYPSAKCVYKIKEDVDNLKSDILETGETSDTFIHVEDSAMAEYQELSVDGVCEQVTTSGKNLYDLTGDVIAHKLPQTLPAGTYTFSVDKKNVSSLGVRLSKTEDTSVDSVLENLYKPTLDGQRLYLTLETTFEANYINVSSNDSVTFPMLEIGATATSYEPYTGGQHSPNPDYPQEIKTIENSLKITSCNKNLLDWYNANWLNKSLMTDGITKNSDGTITFTASGSGYAMAEIKITLLKGTYCFNSSHENNTVLLYGSKDLNKNGFTLDEKKQITIRVYIPKAIKGSNVTISSMQITKGTQQSQYIQHLETQITANLPEGESIGKINDTYKDRLKIEYNEEDGQYHLNLYKRVYKNNSYNGESYNYYISTTARKDGNIECGELQTGQVVYYDGDETIVDLGICDMPITYNEVTNLFTDSDLMPQINAKYYKNFISTIRDLQINNNTLKNELASIENRLAELEKAKENVTNNEEASI